ncbi:MAG: tetratricopeptide repeat protein [Acidobacteria bacterium]|nr:tetratricopeptide repeat protein [Acidobacteriota bacterium]
MILKNVWSKSALVCLLLAGLAASLPAAGKTTAAESAVFTLTTNGADGKELRKGVGFFIRVGLQDKTKRLFLTTALQNLEGARGAYILDNQGKSIPILLVYTVDEPGNLAVLWLDNVQQFKALEVADSAPTLGAKMRVVLRGPDNGILVKEGVLESVQSAPRGTRFFQITGIEGHVPAGCPVMDTSGGLVGVTTAQIEEDRPLVLAQFIQRLQGLAPGERQTIAQAFSGMIPGMAELKARGSGALVNGRYDLAGQCFDTLLKKDPNDVDGWLLKGFAAFQKKDFTTARQAAEKAVQLAPDDPEVHNLLGSVYRQSGQAARAEEHYRRAIDLNADLAAAHFNLANLHRTQKKLDQAIDGYRQAIRIDPQYAEAQYNLGLCFVMKQQVADAVTHFQQAVTLAPNDAEAHYSLGLALFLSGNRDGALNELKTLQKLNSSLAGQLEKAIRGQ